MVKQIIVASMVWMVGVAVSWQAQAAMTVYPQPNIFKGVNMIALADVEASVLSAFSLKQGIDSENLQLQILGFEKGIRVELDAPSYDMDVTQLDVNQRTRQFGADIVFTTATGETQKVELHGRFDEVVQVPVLVSRLPAKHVITADDIRYETLPTHRLHRQMIRDEGYLIGKMLRRSAPVGRPLRESNVMKPLLIERNSAVTMIYETPHMTIRTMAVALEDGAAGDVIRVRNANSSRIVQATIEGSTQVRVGHYKGENVL